ncbi:MAG: alpha-1,4-glucan--maltose-1-phosphate maltosyltransferase [Rubrobacter sp.]
MTGQRLQTTAGPVIIEDFYPELDAGRYPVKREVGDALEVEADIFRDGHDAISAVLKCRLKGRRKWTEAPMQHVVNDRWRGSVELVENARYEYTAEAWPDEYATWVKDVGKKLDAGQNVALETEEGRTLVEEAFARTKDPSLETVLIQTKVAPTEERIQVLRDASVADLMARHTDRSVATTYQTREVIVDRVAARYAAWYEMFQRSQGTEPGRSATFRECEARLPEIAGMGFDVVYLLPPHPIGRSHRKGPNNTLNAGPDDPGSPYAVGGEEGGHKAVHPELGMLEDFRHFVGACHEHGMEVALDFAIQCSPDHPYIKEHPDWFKWRPDGTIKYAENPPKKYQDIVNVDFYTDDWEALWREWLSVVLFWVEQGVKIFRVDNPHTKSFGFWEWCIREVQKTNPEVIFLAEAFTRPKVMKNLAKLGFSQSYTYFTWRHEKWEFTEYLEELTQGEPKEYMRPNFFPSTPDINPYILQSGKRGTFQMRLFLAATLSSVYGMYNGYELLEHVPVPGKEELLNSEKYEYKVRDWDAPGNIKGYVKRINELRKENVALQELTNLRFHPANDDNILFYGKQSGEGKNLNAVFCAVNLDPDGAHDTHVQFPLWELGILEDEEYVVEELMSGREMVARGSWFWVRLVPEENPAEMFRLRRV